MRTTIVDTLRSMSGAGLVCLVLAASPSLAADSAGNVSIVYDSYRAGNYDVYVRTLKNGTLGAEIPVASSPLGERSASAVYDQQDRLWVAYEDIGVNWSKDFERLALAPCLSLNGWIESPS